MDLKPKYFAEGKAIWRDAGLPQCQQLADDLRSGRERFKHLHAAQLLNTRSGSRGTFEHASAPRAMAARGRPRTRFATFITGARADPLTCIAPKEHFAERVGVEIRFSASTYQDLYRALAADVRVERGYPEYLRVRYFRVV